MITVLTPAVPDRIGATLGRALESVRAQTLAPSAHVIVLDYAGEGSARARNRALEAVTTRYVATLDDDDELRPEHLETLLHAAEETGAAVVYSDPDPAGYIPPGVGRPFDADLIEERNFIPSTALIRTAALRDLGGWPDLYAEDWGLWILAARAGLEFHHVAVPTWVYHRAAGKQSRRPKDARGEVLRYVGSRD